MNKEEQKIIVDFVNNENFCIIEEYISKPYIKTIEELQKENDRLYELCMYALISSTYIYNHELANNTKQTFKDIIKNNLEDDTHTLREKIKFYWENYWKVILSNERRNKSIATYDRIL